MGTIRRQSIYSSLFIYAGFAIGAFNVLVLFPRYFTPEQFGLTRIILDIAMIFSTVCLAGSLPVSYKFFPFYRSHLRKEDIDLPALLLVFSIITCGILFFTMPYLQPWIFRKFGYRSPLLVDHFDLVFPMTVSLVVFSLLESAAWFLGKTIPANFLKEFAFRGITLLLIAGWLYGFITDFRVFIFGYAYSNFIPVFILFIVIYKERQLVIQWKLSKVSKRLRWYILKFGSAYFMSALLNILAKTNDTLIIASQSTGGLADAAVFTIATYLITLMDVPQRSMISSAITQIAQAWKDRDMSKIDRLYQKTALNLLIIAACILGFVMINKDILVHILGANYTGLPMLMFVLGLGKLIDLGTGMNSQILQLSKHWKIDLFSNIFFVAVSIFLNYFLTKAYGIMGTAFGNLTAVVFFNLIRFYYIKKMYGLQPFSMKNVYAIVLAILLASGIYFLPQHPNLWLNSILKSALFLALYGFSIIRFNVSADMTELYSMLIQRFQRSRKGG